MGQSTAINRRPLGSACVVEMQPLSREGHEALKADILARGQQVPIEVDADTEQILDGANRARAIEELGIEPLIVRRSFASDSAREEHAIKLNILRRQMDPVTWGEQFKRLAAIRGAQLGQGARNDQTSATVAEVARELGVSRRTAEERRAAAELPDAIKEKVRGGLPLKRAKRIEREARPKPPAPPGVFDDCALFNCSCEDLIERVDAGSVDAIITDPPYKQEHLHCWTELGVFAAHALNEGGSLLAMSGQAWLPDVLRLLLEPEELHWQWELDYYMPGPSRWEHPRRINNERKPILWLVKGRYEGKWIASDRVTSDQPPAKIRHSWEQSLTGMEQLVERASRPGDRVLDPFLGSGTTAVAALKLGRSFIGADINPDCIATTENRLAAPTEEDQ